MAATRYWQKMKRLQALEARFTPAIKLALIRQAEPAAAALEQFTAMPDSIGIDILVQLVSSRWLIAPLEALYQVCGEVEASDTYEYLTRAQKSVEKRTNPQQSALVRKALAPTPVKDGWLARLKSFITTEGAAAVRGITETTRQVVRRVLNESAAAGEGIAVAAARLRTEVAGLATERARKIVRTELVSASNYGSTLGAEATGLRLDKYWISTKDGRTRYSHAVLNGVRAPLQGGTFSVSGFLARYPGDPVLPAGERVNCRCSIGYRPLGDE